MSGIVFNNTSQMPRIVDFYKEIIGAREWINQGRCVILKHHNFLFGFCSSENTDKCGVLTFFYPKREMVLDKYRTLKEFAISEPRENTQFNIFNFFAKDPDDRIIEFQTFQHHINSYWTGEQLLKLRRSIRNFSSEPVTDTTVNRVFELCRYSPTSRNSQAYYYLMTRNKDLAHQLAAQRERAARPLAESPMVVAVCTDPSQTKRPEEDACIAAAYFLLAAAQLGLGTCWIGGMNTDKVKKLLSIPKGHYIACLTPVGYPAEIITEIPERRCIDEFVKVIK